VQKKKHPKKRGKTLMQNQEFKKIKKLKKGKFWGRLVSNLKKNNNQVSQLLGQQGGSY
jgi:hypothetical protein